MTRRRRAAIQKFAVVVTACLFVPGLSCVTKAFDLTFQGVAAGATGVRTLTEGTFRTGFNVLETVFKVLTP